jgi:hypothetical protein
MARKKKENMGADAAPETTTTTKEAEAPSEPMVTILKTVETEKLSPRGDGKLVYQICRRGDTVYLRLYKNEQAGRMSTELVPVSALRRALSKVPKGEKLFKSSILAEAWVGRSSTNPGFGCACLKNEGVLVSDPEKKGMLKLAEPSALEQWEAAILTLPVPDDAEKIPFHPAKAKPFFSRKKDDATVNESPVTDVVGPVDEVEPVAAADEGDAGLDDDA